MSNPCKLILPPAPHDDHRVRITDRRVVARRVQRMGISITEIAERHRDEVREWAAMLTEVEVESVVETVRTIREHDAEFTGDD